MGKVVNLNKFRKAKVKAARQTQARANRIAYGRTKAERAREALEKKRLESKVEGALLERPASDAPDVDE